MDAEYEGKLQLNNQKMAQFGQIVLAIKNMYKFVK